MKIASLFKSVLKPSESVMVALATGAFVYGVYQYSLPSVTEVHGAMPHNNNVNSSVKKARFTAGGAVAAVFLITHDANVFNAGALTLVALDWSYRHANAVHPESGQLVPQTGVQALNHGYSMDAAGGDDYSG